MVPFLKGAAALVFVLSFAIATGQNIPAPVISCVSANQISGDVVLDFMPAALNPCGTFVDYKVFCSEAGGSYQLVGTLTNPTDTSFTHSGAGATATNQWCYKMIMDQNCVGSVPDTSAPVCSFVLNIPRFTYITVTPAGVQINWSATVSPAVNSFVILYIDPATGLSISLDTVANTVLTYLDTHNNPNNGYITYTIKSLDPCDNPSIQDDSVQSTIYLTAQPNACLQQTAISFNRYENWPYDTAKTYVLETVIDGGTPADTTLGNLFAPGIPLTQRQTVNYSIAGLTGNEICFTIIATSPDGAYQSRSNQVCMPLKLLHSTQFNYASDATVLDSNTIAFSWLIDTTAQIDSFYIKRSTDGQNFNVIKTLPAGTNSVFELTYNDNPVNTGESSYYYEVTSKDTCGYMLTSTTAQTIFLTATSTSPSVDHLSWNAFGLPNANVLNYTVYRVRSDGTIIADTTVLPSVLSYDDQVTDAISNNGVFCYRIVANYVLNIPNIDISKTYTTSSNDVCVTKDPVVYIPNAFVPGGVNTTFRPIFLFNVNDYDFRIFDRWGKQVFATQDIVAGWDGTYNGEKMPLGGYVYQLKATAANGDVLERHGVVALIR